MGGCYGALQKVAMFRAPHGTTSLTEATNGEVSEWSKVPDSKSGVAKVTEGSNPSLSASYTRFLTIFLEHTRRGVRVVEGA
jgi:hypothetical protein